MPDWFYRPVARPLLFRLPDRAARALALGLIGRLARLPGGGRVIDFLGHMRADPTLSTEVGGVRYPSPLLLGWRVDPEQRAAAGLARFGIGGVEMRSSPHPDVRREGEGLCETEPVRFATSPITNAGASTTPSLQRLKHESGAETLIAPDGARWPVLAWDAPASANTARGLVLQVGERGADGLWHVPLRPPAALAGQVAAWRALLGPEPVLVVAGGVAEPADAVALRAAGADLLIVEAGLVFSGPSLVKRGNAALLAARRATTSPPTEPTDGPPRPGAIFRQAWFWAAALGAAMLGGGMLALGLAATRVLLPYDEHYLGLTTTELARRNPRLLAFMAHDRATLAGVMLGLGWLYWRLARDGIRLGDHAAWLAVTASALTGFASFFYFLGFGYFDPLHAFVTAVLFQLLLLVLQGEQPIPAAAGPALDQREDAIWRCAQIGQLLLILHALGLLGAGLIISIIGLTRVFVAEDLAFLCITAGEVTTLGERLVAVVAHDRATLGGMLLATGVASLLPVLWRFERGAHHLRTALIGLGAPAYAAAIGVHYLVGYDDWRHLLPAWLGASLWSAGLALVWRYLATPPQARSP